MSEFTNHKQERVARLTELFEAAVRGEINPAMVGEYQDVIDRATPADVISVVDWLLHLKLPMNDLKKGINKALNLLSKTLREFPYTAPAADSLAGYLIQNNEQLDLRLKAIRPFMKEINGDPENQAIRNGLREKFADLSKMDLHYQIKENVLFPLIEAYMPDYNCLQVMWSLHDDIRENIKTIVGLLAEPGFDLKQFNRLAGDVFFDMYAIRFREERILFPVALDLIPEKELSVLLNQCIEIGFPFIHPEIKLQETSIGEPATSGEIDLKTGFLSAEQIVLLFNHLPVDITYVDEFDKVKFFSTPEKRIFRRTNSIIGREVKNCHPPESVHVVEQIVEAFRNGEKDKASFWIQMKGEFILIQYFAVRDEQGNYRGVVEVSQEITEIRTLEGEQRLLDWGK
ncbi:MAG: PAS domain-containing protein [Bacteroidota bacterium]|nr:PAS domain-containing protein [Bacteroidota bacterium]